MSTEPKPGETCPTCHEPLYLQGDSEVLSVTKDGLGCIYVERHECGSEECDPVWHLYRYVRDITPDELYEIAKTSDAAQP